MTPACDVEDGVSDCIGDEICEEDLLEPGDDEKDAVGAEPRQAAPPEMADPIPYAMAWEVCDEAYKHNAQKAACVTNLCNYYGCY